MCSIYSILSSDIIIKMYFGQRQSLWLRKLVIWINSTALWRFKTYSKINPQRNVNEDCFILLKFFVKMLALTLEKKKQLKNLSEPNTVHSTVLAFILDGKYRAKRNFSFLRFLQSKDKKTYL